MAETAPVLGNDVGLVVIDAQVGFDDVDRGSRNNPGCDGNIAALVGSFAAAHLPLVYVRHESASRSSTLHPNHPGNALKPYLRPHSPDLVVSKSVHSAFHGTPDLDSWLRRRGIGSIVLCGITTNHCCETTARLAADLGYRVWFALDATHTFDRVGPDGSIMTADQLSRATATNLDGEFAMVVRTTQILETIGTGR